MAEVEPKVMPCTACEGSGRMIIQVGGMRSAGDWPCQWCAGIGRRIEPREDWADVEDEWSDRIKSAHPTRSGSHADYATAMRMVGARRSKGALVELVNWLLQR